MSSFVPFRSRRIAALSFAVVLSGAVPFTHAFAQQASAQQAAAGFGTMAPIVVTPTLFPVPPAEIGSDVTVITAADIARKQANDLPSILRDVPGLMVVQSSPGNIANVFIRGTNSNHTKFLIDGIDISDPSQPSGTFDISQIPTSDIERIEVLRGPQSGLYGSDAIGGVVNIITKQGSGPLRADSSIEGGSFGTFNQAASVSGSQGRANYAFNFTHLHYSDRPEVPSNLLAPGEAAIGDAFGERAYSAKLGADLTDDLSASLVARYYDSLLRNTADDDFAPFTTPDATQSLQDERAGFARGSAKLKSFGGALEDEFGIAYTRYHRVNITPSSSISTSDGDRTKADWRGTLHLDADRTAVLGVEDEEDRLIEGQPVNATVNTAAGFAEYHTPIVENLYGNVTGRIDSNNRFGRAFTYRFAPAYLVAATNTQLKASYGTGFKAPSLEQLFVSFPAFNFFANPNLKPEKSSGYDAGFEQPLLDKRLSFGATYFHNHIRNLIEQPAGSNKDLNIAAATAYGVESFVAVTPIETVTLRADYTYTQAASDSPVTNSSGTIVGDALIRRPKHKISIDGTWTPIDPLSVTAEWLYVGARFDNNRDFSNKFPLHVNSYNTINLNASYRLADYATVFGRIDNLLDRHYQNPTGFLGPTLGVFAGVRLSWGGAPSGDAN
ncbi:MAG: TonB-dependent receptor [Alphaproteobacteria bacterium]|nr:TonB-dependent receptor [Alphaproteobacteria bacterium]